jgi:DNA-binding NtrC family response regulator
VKNGSFRQDLFYRIKTIEINLPPLRERKEDIPDLFHHYFDQYCKRYNKTMEMDDSLIAYLCNYKWPGNIRELQHAIERAVILCKEQTLSAADFQLTNAAEPDREINSLNLSDMEREVIQKALNKFGNNLTKAAEELGIGRTTLYRKIEEYGLS